LKTVVVYDFIKIFLGIDFYFYAIFLIFVKIIKLINMKKLYFLAATLMMGGISFAQTTVYSASTLDDFSAGSVVDVDQDGNAWGVYNLLDTDGMGTPLGTAYDAQGEVLGSFSYDNASGTPLTPDNWWVTPGIDLSNITNAELSWGRVATDATYFAENYSVYVVAAADINAAVTAFATATPVYTETIAAGDEWLVRTADISALDGEGSVFIGFRHHDVTDEFFLILDDITVTGTETTSGVLEASLNLNTFPNPASDVLNISLAEPMSSVTVVGMDGRTVISSAVAGMETTVDVSPLLPGVYYFTVVTEKGNVVRNSFVKK
jgi:hypothetical protein